MSWLAHPLALRISRIVLAAVMLMAAIPKLMDPPGFAQAVFAYGLLPMALVAPLALTLPWLEALTALGLVLGVARRSAAALILFLMVVFMGGLGFNLAKGNPVDCGCFGASKVQKTRDQRLFDMKLAMLRDLGLALLALHSLVAPERKPE
ncbi:MAG: DoxX family membrane protein [Acidobacteriota bacterium]|nr:DoxX family membrane protein [Acidobacteriota bacterium]